MKKIVFPSQEKFENTAEQNAPKIPHLSGIPASFVLASVLDGIPSGCESIPIPHPVVSLRSTARYKL